MSPTKHFDERSSPRTLVLLPIQITSQLGPPHTQVGVVRDVSKESIFFFTHFKPELESTINFVLEIGGSSIPCTGKVVRVQEASPGAAIGVAVKMQDCNALTDSLIKEAAQRFRIADLKS